MTHVQIIVSLGCGFAATVLAFGVTLLALTRR